MNWFEGCSTLEEVRTRYRKLAFQHHPDLGGRVEVMQDINVQYERVTSQYVRRQNPNQTQEWYSAYDSINEAIRRIVEQLVRLQGIKVEIVGKWVWVSGNTFPHREELKRLGLQWASKKQMWYYAGIPARNRRPYSMDEIRTFFGSVVVKDDDSSKGT